MISSLDLEWIDVVEITRGWTRLHLPLVKPELNRKLRQGVYQMLYKGAVIKNGCFGEGIGKGISKRFNQYRSTISRLDLIRNGTLSKNGSFKTIHLLDLKLSPGETVQVRSARVPDDMFINNLPWKVDLYAIEAYLKELHKDTIWLI